MLRYSNKRLVEVSLRQLSSIICGQAMETASPPWRWKEAYKKALRDLTGAQRLMKEPGKEESTARDLSNECS